MRHRPIRGRPIIPNHIGPDLAGGCLSSGGIYWKGDDRGFSATSSKFRAQHKVTYRSEPIGAILSNMRAVGQTRSYAPDAISNNGVIGPEDEDGTSGDCVLFHQSGTAMTTGMNVMETQSNGVRIFGGAANPLAPADIAIDWDYTINFNAANPSQPTYALTVTHDCYPAHEAYIDGQTIYTFTPSGNNISHIVSCLIGMNPVTDIRSGTVQ